MLVTHDSAVARRAQCTGVMSKGRLVITSAARAGLPPGAGQAGLSG